MPHLPTALSPGVVPGVRMGGSCSHLQEEVLHDVVVVGGAAVWEEAGSKHDDGIETFAVVPWGEAAREWLAL